MAEKYVLSIDQSTQGTKALLFDGTGNLVCRADRNHRQIVSDEGWVSHDLEEIYLNTIMAVRDVIEKAGINKNDVQGLGISNQRETAAVWDRNGKPAADAVVWQCARSAGICYAIEKLGKAGIVREKTGIRLSPYFPASKFAWLLQNVSKAGELNRQGELMFGTIDTWLLYKLTGGKAYKTDYSNASRTQLFHLQTLQWDPEVCDLFGIRTDQLAEVCDSNSVFGETDFEGYLPSPIPICGVLGDSHGALFGQGCIRQGMMKATYGTGSSVMLNIGEKPVFSSRGAVTSLAWGIDGTVNYVLEGNINYTGAVISWLQRDLQLIGSARETAELAERANPEDATYIVPAFTGLGAPYWYSDAKALITGMSRLTGKKEIVKAALECIAYQIADIVDVMKEEAGIEIEELRADGGAAGNGYLMQFQSDITEMPVLTPDAEELSGIGAAYMAGLKLELYDKTIFEKLYRKQFLPVMDHAIVRQKKKGWHEAVELSVHKSEV